MASAKQIQARLADLVAAKVEDLIQHRLDNGKYIPLEALLLATDKILEAAEARERTGGIMAAANLYKLAGVMAAEAAQYLHSKPGTQAKDEEATNAVAPPVWENPPWLTQYLQLQERVMLEQSRMSRALPSSRSTPGDNAGH